MAAPDTPDVRDTVVIKNKQSELYNRLGIAARRAKDGRLMILVTNPVLVNHRWRTFEWLDPKDLRVVFRPGPPDRADDAVPEERISRAVNMLQNYLTEHGERHELREIQNLMMQVMAFQISPVYQNSLKKAADWAASQKGV